MKLNNFFKYIQNKFKETTVDNIIWWINLTPKRAGISILTHENSALFWITHFALLSYMNFFSNFVNRIILSDDADGVVKANANLSIVIFTVNISVWFFTKRSLLISTIDKVKEVDKLVSETAFSSVKHKQLLKKVKILVLLYYSFNFVNIFMIWLPLRMDISSTLYTDYPCPGLNVTKEINKHICRAIVYFQDVTVSIVVINYQSLLLFFIAHTAAMYVMMSEEMLALNRFEDTDTDRAQVKKMLSLLIKRHILLLDTVQRLRSLYSTPIGIDFAANAYFMCLFFTLSLKDWINFGPLLGYCFIVFFLYCFLCQRLIDVSIFFENSIYACGWEKFGLSDKKTVYILFKLAQRPVRLLAADIIAIDLKTFATTLQYIYKFITALKV